MPTFFRCGWLAVLLCVGGVVGGVLVVLLMVALVVSHPPLVFFWLLCYYVCNVQAPAIPEQHPGRLEFIRNNDTNGREYNPVTGAKYKHYKPTMPERRNVREAHPSIASLSRMVDR